jgi:hypothetical protein
MRAAEAARNTADLISGTAKNVNEGARLASTTAKAFSEVGSTMENTAELMAAIAAASKKQALGIEQIHKAVAEMDKATQTPPPPRSWRPSPGSSRWSRQHCRRRAPDLQGMRLRVRPR